MNSTDRSVRVSRLQDQGKDDLLLSMTVEERMAMMWPLAIDAWAFMGVKLEPEFSRHVVRVVRNKRSTARPKDLADVAWLEASPPRDP